MKSMTLVIPAHNEEAHIQACLESIAAQTVLPKEVIVVDNNSTDRTVAIARSFPFVKIVKEKRRGIVFARNAGFDAASGDIIGRIDADITLPSNWVEHLLAFYNQPKNKQQAWSGKGYFYNVRIPRLASWGYALMSFHFNRLLLGHYTLWGSNMAITKQQWQQTRTKTHNRVDIHEDLDLAIHLHQAGYGITYDRHVQTMAELRPLYADRHEKWQYLQWWPRTLRVHGKKSWVVCWFFGAFLMYLAALFLLAAERLARLVGKRPLAP